MSVTALDAASAHVRPEQERPPTTGVEVVVAVVGGGPKAFSAVERLVHRWLHRSGAADSWNAELSVHVHEPDRFGAGAVWNAHQPDELRVNFAADAIDAWVRGAASDRCAIVPAHEQRDLTGWLDALGASDPFPSRRLVGEYLTEAAATLVRYLPPSVRFTHHRSRVDRVESVGGGRWRLIADDGSELEADHVLLATGHAPSWDGAMPAGPHAPCVPAYPTSAWEAHLTDAAPGSVIAVRGFGLTAIDVALRAEAIAPHVVLSPFTRTGRPMLAKPLPAMAPLTGRNEALDVGRRVLAAAPSKADHSPTDLIVEAVVAAVTAVAPELRADALSYMTTGSAMVSCAPTDELRASVRQGLGHEPPTAAAYVGDAWRRLYPELVDVLADRGPGGCWSSAIDRLQQRLERLAFGPPPTTAGRFLGMIERGQVRLDALTGATLDTSRRPVRLRTANGELPVELVIDAVLPPPGVPSGSTGPVAELLAAGHLRRVEGGRGIVVMSDGACLDAAGRAHATLSAIGRPTEDCVVGNDTLSRTLHDVADRWARRVAQYAGVRR